MLLVLLLFALFLLVLLGFYVVVAAPRRRAHQTFAAFVFCLALWTVKDIALWEFTAREGRAEWWATASFLLALALQYSLVVFALVFPEDRPVPLRRIAALFSPGAVFVPATLAGLMWHDARFVNQRFSIKLTPLAYAFGLYIYVVFAYGFALLYAKRRSLRGRLAAQQLGAIMWGLVLTGVLLTATSVALPLVGVYGLLPYASVFFLPGVFVYAYAVSSFQLFSLQSALDQFRLFPIAYKVALSIAVVAVSSFVLLQVPIVWWSFGAATDDAWKRYLVFSVITALLPNLILVALVIRIITRPLRRLTEAAVTVAAGEYGATVEVESNDEVGLLASSFNEMSRKMSEDIERLRALGEQLVRTEKLAAAGQLAAGVAHEVNNPLASISSLVQILQARIPADTEDDRTAETREMLRVISQQIARITQVLRDMTDFARQRPPARAPLDISRAIEASLRLASFDENFKRLNLATDFDPQAPLISADADQLQQVFLNLLLNARDAMPEGGDLKVSTHYDARSAEITIEIGDTGAGIAPEHLAHVFDPFFTTKPAGRGTGLGLAVCYGIITAHGGRIEIAPDDSRGTRVRVAIPTQTEAR
ncbi:MAG: two-component system, NtrC family, sensor kinase [Acidobacteriota bacterium]|jgi:signal transduction histidine kinase|nr:two-component system, NtrC family, sensor kinase [Acidobacteriota bacterium]